MKNGEKSFGKLFVLLELVARSQAGLSGKELAEAAEIPQSTTFRILKFLTGKGYLRSDKGIYTLGLGFVRLGNVAYMQNPLIKVSRPLLTELSLQTQETAHLATLQHGKIIYVDKVEGSRLIRMGSLIGKSGPLHCTSVGKVILAFQEEKTQEKLLEQIDYKAFTQHTITGADALRKELKQIRTQGYAIDNCEHEDWIFCIAAPIFNGSGECVAGISLSGAEMYMQNRRQQLAGLLLAAARQISAEL